MRQKLAVQDLPIELVHKKMPADILSRERNDENDASAADLVTWNTVCWERF